MKTAFIIQGSCGAGKTTVARRIAEQRQAVHLPHDFFLFDLVPYKPEGKEHYSLGNQFIRSCFEIAVKNDKDIVLDGALITLNPEENQFDLQVYINHLREEKYSVVHVALQCSYSTAKERMKKRHLNNPDWSPVPEQLFHTLDVAVKDSLPDTVIQINTDDMSVAEVVQKVLAQNGQ